MRARLFRTWHQNVAKTLFKAQLTGQFRCEDIFTTTLPEASFDLVYSLGVIALSRTPKHRREASFSNETRWASSDQHSNSGACTAASNAIFAQSS